MSAPLWQWYLAAAGLGTAWLAVRWRGTRMFWVRLAVFLAAVTCAYLTVRITQVPHGDPAVAGWTGDPRHWTAAGAAVLALCPAPRRRSWRG